MGGGGAFALLHAAPGVSGLYSKYGFTAGLLNVPCVSLRIEVGGGGGGRVASANGLPAGAFIRAVDFVVDTPALQTLRADTLTRVKAVGGIERDTAYWNQWIPATTRGGAIALFSGVGVGDGDGGGRILAYASVILREGVLRLYDWALAGEFSGGCCSEGIRTFFAAAVQSAPGFAPPSAGGGGGGGGGVGGGGGGGVGGGGGGGVGFEAGAGAEVAPACVSASESVMISLVVPMLLARDALGAEADLKVDDALSDKGWMARELRGGGGGLFLRALYQAAQAGTFLVLAADGF